MEEERVSSLLKESYLIRELVDKEKQELVNRKRSIESQAGFGNINLTIYEPGGYYRASTNPGMKRDLRLLIALGILAIVIFSIFFFAIGYWLRGIFSGKRDKNV